MSVVKNTTSNTDATVSIARMGVIPNTGDTTYTVRRFMTMKNCCFDTYNSVGSAWAGYDDTVLIWCSFPAAASGYFFGYYNSGSTASKLAIRKSGNSIIWEIKSQSYTKTVTDWVDDKGNPVEHRFGFIKGRPWADGSFLPNTSEGAKEMVGGRACIGGALKMVSSTAHYDCVSEWNFHRAMMHSRMTNSTTHSGVDTPQVTFSYAPCTNGTSPTYYSVMNAKGVLQSHNGTESQVTSSAVLDTDTDFTYGVSIDDMRVACGSGRIDWVAIICEDGGAAASDADAADVLVDSNNNKFYSAFALADSGSGRPNKIPLPSGWTLQARPNTDFVNYRCGDLIRGRNPKWKLWASWSDVYKHVQEESANSTYLRINIFKSMTGAPRLVHGEDWAGYNNDPLAAHAPNLVLEAGNDVVIDYHNGMAVITDREDYTKNLCAGPNTVDDKGIYKYSVETNGHVNVVLGNTIPWNTALASLPDNYKMYGGVAYIRAEEDDNIIATVVSNAGEVLCANATAAHKATYRVNGFTANFAFNPDRTQAMWYRFFRNGFSTDNESFINTRTSLGLLRYNTSTPTDGQVTRLERIIPPLVNSSAETDPARRPIFKGRRDPKNSLSALNYRIVVGDNGHGGQIRTGISGQTESWSDDIWIASTAASGRELTTLMINEVPTPGQPSSRSQDGIMLPFLGVTAGEFPVGNVYAFLMLFVADSNGAISGRYTKMMKCYTHSEAMDKFVNGQDPDIWNPVARWHGEGGGWNQLYHYDSEGTWVHPSSTGYENYIQAAIFRVADIKADNSDPITNISSSSTAWIRLYVDDSSNNGRNLPYYWDVNRSSGRRYWIPQGCSWALRVPEHSGNPEHYLFFPWQEQVVSAQSKHIMDVYFSRWTCPTHDLSDPSAWERYTPTSEPNYHIVFYKVSNTDISRTMITSIDIKANEAKVKDGFDFSLRNDRTFSGFASNPLGFGSENEVMMCLSIDMSATGMPEQCGYEIEIYYQDYQP